MNLTTANLASDCWPALPDAELKDLKAAQPRQEDMAQFVDKNRNPESEGKYQDKYSNGSDGYTT